VRCASYVQVPVHKCCVATQLAFIIVRLVKPRIFIGSSGSSRNFAEAIHARLEDVAECTVWTAGAFALSTSTLAGLLTNLRDSDFGIFVFAADDDMIVKGKLLKVPRDNVVYEAGLFSGYLCPERCFIVVPKSVEVHVPTDLAGMTRGFYDDSRTDGNDDAAVLTFSNQVKKQVLKDGLFRGSNSEELRDLVVRFECCQSWMEDEDKRVAMKKKISGDIESFCKTHSLNKHRLLVHRRTGYYLALLAAIRFRPDNRDWEIVLKMAPDRLPPGFAYFKLIDAIEAIKDGGKATPDQLKKLHDWLSALPDVRKHIGNRVDALVK
jgi:predicted nucleotide-binding protein